MNTVTGWLKSLALVAEWLGSAVAAVAVIAGQVNNGHPLNATAIIAAVLSLLGHATTHTTSTTSGG